MEAILKFTLPDEETEFRTASNATRTMAELSDLDNDLRSYLKYEQPLPGVAHCPEPGKSVDAMVSYVRARLAQIVDPS